MQRSPLAELVNKIAIIPGLQQLIKAYDVGTGLEPVVNGQLVIDILFDFCVLCEHLVADDLDGEEAAFLEVLCLKDLTV